MKGLMELLANADAPKKSSDSLSDSTLDESSDDGAIDSGGFSESASQAMDALKAGDQEAFSDALKACIEMVR